MNELKIKRTESLQVKSKSGQEGSALVIAVFVLILISVFVAMALSRTSIEAAAIGNETAEGRTFYAAQASLEVMTRNFNKVFEVKLSPSNADFDPVRNGAVPRLDTQYDFDQRVRQTSASKMQTLTGDNPFAGLYAQRDNWQLRTTATDTNTGVEVELTRNILNNRIPIFQFGIFYNDDMELHPGARFDFGGRVHSNGSMFLMSSNGIYFSSKVSAVGEIITDVNRNGKAWNDGWGDDVHIKKVATGYERLKYDMGSALRTPNGTALFRDPLRSDYNPDMPTVYKSAAWTSTNKAKFEGNLLSGQKSLDLPLRIASANADDPLDYVELIKRGRSVGDLHNTGGTSTAPVIEPVVATHAKADTIVTTGERYYNKTGLRITLADSKAKLPGCASGTGTNAVNTFCGVRLDGKSVKPANPADAWDDANTDGSRGYQPLAMSDGYQATRLNGDRFHIPGREVWIKIEMVSKNATTNVINAVEVTEDILSLGVTEAAPASFGITPYPSGTDSRSIVKLQRFTIPGVAITSAANRYITALNVGGEAHNIVVAEDRPTGGSTWTARNDYLLDKPTHHKTFTVSGSPGTDRRIVPFPIEMFDAREGIYNVDSATTPVVFNASTTYGSNVPWAGVMSLVDIDITNLKTFLDGGFNVSMPTGTKFHAGGSTLAHTHVPQNNGWVVYASDRRGDYDFDGEYDMEDVFGRNDTVRQTGEDVNKNNALDYNYTATLGTVFDREAVRYVGDGAFNLGITPPTGIHHPVQYMGSYAPPGYAATVDHPYYRRGFRLIKGERLPGIFDYDVPANTRGFTFASENGVYVQGNYNATGVRPGSTGSPTPYEDYFPQGKIFINGVEKTSPTNSQYHIPASVVGDAVTVLSNNWNDAKSFRYPYTPSDRQATETFTRFAMIAGDPLSSLIVAGQPNQGSGDARLSGGVHNFKRYLEQWGSSVKLNYCGSLINLYNARNNNGTQKSGGVYGAPQRNWVFDSTFLDPGRLPPGTPYFQFIQTTGFQRTNN